MGKGDEPPVGGQTGTCHLGGLPSKPVFETCCVPWHSDNFKHHSRNVSVSFFLNLSLNNSFTITYNVSTKAGKTGRSHSINDSLISESWKHQTNENKHHHQRRSTSITCVQTKSKILNPGRNSLCAGQNSTASVSLWPHSDK